MRDMCSKKEVAKVNKAFFDKLRKLAVKLGRGVKN